MLVLAVRPAVGAIEFKIVSNGPFVEVNSIPHLETLVSAGLYKIASYKLDYTTFTGAFIKVASHIDSIYEVMASDIDGNIIENPFIYVVPDPDDFTITPGECVMYRYK